MSLQREKSMVSSCFVLMEGIWGSLTFDIRTSSRQIFMCSESFECLPWKSCVASWQLMTRQNALGRASGENQGQNSVIYWSVQCLRRTKSVSKFDKLFFHLTPSCLPSFHPYHPSGSSSIFNDLHSNTSSPLYQWWIECIWQYSKRSWSHSVNDSVLKTLATLL